MSGQDGRWEQFDTTCSLISAPQWHHTPHSGPSWFIYLFIYLFIINFSQKDRGHTKGEPVLGAPPYTHTYIQLQGQNTKNKQKL